MSYGFRTISEKVAPCMLSVLTGYLGHSSVRWLNERNKSPSSSSTVQIVTYKNRQPEIREISSLEFRCYACHGP